MSMTFKTRRSDGTAARKSREHLNWAVTPLQGILGRRMGIRYHWFYWAAGLGFSGVIGVALGIKIGRGSRRSPGA